MVKGRSMSQVAITNEYKQYYLDVWKALFRVFLGWSDAETLQWAKRWTATDGSDPLDDPDDIFYHETPQYWATNTLIPDGLRERISHSDWLDLQQRVRHAFWDEHYMHFPLDTDWRPYRAKIEQILAEYGASLPTVATR
jgi:hypothetical protein